MKLAILYNCYRSKTVLHVLVNQLEQKIKSFGYIILKSAHFVSVVFNLEITTNKKNHIFRDRILEEAVKYVSEEADIRLIATEDTKKPRPLVVFCKNDSKLQEDIDNAYKKNKKFFERGKLK